MKFLVKFWDPGIAAATSSLSVEMLRTKTLSAAGGLRQAGLSAHYTNGLVPFGCTMSEKILIKIWDPGVETATSSLSVEMPRFRKPGCMPPMAAVS